MTKKPAPAKKPVSDSTRQLIDAIATVKHLQDFIREHGDLEKTLQAVVRVNKMIELTGGVEQLRQALEIVGKEAAPPQG
jgi:hypothetical protein